MSCQWWPWSRAASTRHAKPGRSQQERKVTGLSLKGDKTHRSIPVMMKQPCFRRISSNLLRETRFITLTKCCQSHKFKNVTINFHLNEVFIYKVYKIARCCAHNKIKATLWNLMMTDKMTYPSGHPQQQELQTSRNSQEFEPHSGFRMATTHPVCQSLSMDCTKQL